MAGQPFVAWARFKFTKMAIIFQTRRTLHDLEFASLVSINLFEFAFQTGMKRTSVPSPQILAAIFAIALTLGVDGYAQVKQGFREAPQRRVESATKNTYCEDSKRLFRACYIPCVKSYESDLGNVVNHCNAECHPELAWVNYLCRK